MFSRLFLLVSVKHHFSYMALYEDFVSTFSMHTLPAKVGQRRIMHWINKYPFKDTYSIPTEFTASGHVMPV